MISDRVRNSLVAAIVAGLVSGCASQPNVMVLPQNAASLVAFPPAGPPACKGQKTTKSNSTAVETLSGKGGSLCIPAFHGFGGALGYPGASPSGKVTVTSTTIDDNFPYPGSGSPIFYLEIALPAATTFGATLRAASGLTAKTIKAKADYTVFLSYKKYGFWYSGSTCYAVAKSGKFGGVLVGLGEVLKSASFGGPYTILLEIYPNKQSGTAC